MQEPIQKKYYKCDRRYTCQMQELTKKKYKCDPTGLQTYVLGLALKKVFHPSVVVLFPFSH
jgi:hypothetical protein